MRTEVPRNLTQEHARLTLTLLDYVIHDLIEIYREMCLLFEVRRHENDDDSAF